MGGGYFQGFKKYVKTHVFLTFFSKMSILSSAHAFPQAEGPNPFGGLNNETPIEDSWSDPQKPMGFY